MSDWQKQITAGVTGAIIGLGAMTEASAEGDASRFGVRTILGVTNVEWSDGESGTLEIYEPRTTVEFRLWGVDAPEGTTRAGRAARTRATELVRQVQAGGHGLTFLIKEDSRSNGREVGILHTSVFDREEGPGKGTEHGGSINHRMVEDGWAIDCQRYAKRDAMHMKRGYQSYETDAMEDERGIWDPAYVGEFETMFRLSACDRQDLAKR